MPENSQGGFWKTAKDGLSVLRESIIIIVLAALLLKPEFVANRLEEAGFIRAELAGFVWEAINQASHQTREAEQQVETLERDLDAIRTSLGALEGQVGEPRAAEEVQRLQTELAKSLSAARSTSNELRMTQDVLDRARTARFPTRPLRPVPNDPM